MARMFCLVILLLGLCPPAVWADGSALLRVEHYRCDGQPLVVQLYAGAVDALNTPNGSEGTRPGAYVVLEWRGQSLQLPRTNNAGVPSFSDGRWWWRALDPQAPEFRQRRGAVQSYACEPQG